MIPQQRISAPQAEHLLHRSFLDQARRTPDRTALIEGDRVVTYAQLESQARRAAAALAAHGVTAESIVGLHIERSIEWVVGVLAILIGGAAVLPLPPSYPRARLRDILSHGGSSAVIDSSSTPLDPDLGRLRLDLGELCSPADASAAETAAFADGRPEQAAFVLCSSGSTGLPKMIVRSHGSFFHRLTWTWKQHPYADGEVCCHKAHTTTTHGIYELFEPLLRGVPVVILSDEEARDLERFWSIVVARGVSRLLIVPSVMQASLDIPRFSPPPLEVLVLMGEYVPRHLAERIIATFPAATRLYSIYGSTEASSTLVCDLREHAGSAAPLPLGRPLTDAIGAHVLGPDLRPVAPGQVGRLYISGPALFTGYFENPELTTKVVIKDRQSGARLYDTRDDVRCLPDGSLEFVGRADDTVKVRGFRIETSEIENAMGLHPGIGQAAVVVGDDAAEVALFGFFTPSTVPPSEVYRVLREHLPPYMIPAALIGLDAFPLTERGKLDRQRLLREARERGNAPHPVMSDVEARVASAWERTLGHRRFDRSSRFFEVGGTSLTTFVLVHYLREAFGLDRDRLPERLAYRFPTIEAMAAYLSGAATRDTSEHAEESSVLVTLRRALDDSAAPLFLVSAAGGTLGAYTRLAAALRFRGEVIGVRDPYLRGEREPTEDFECWVGRYLAAIAQRQPHGPYYIVAYSSAGAFGYELATRLRSRGDVRLLALIDPLGIGAVHRRRFGWWAWRATESFPKLRTPVRLAGWIRAIAGGLLRARARRRTGTRHALSESEYRQLYARVLRAREFHKALAALMELNTGLPLDLSDAAPPEESQNGLLDTLQARIAELIPGTEDGMIERIAVQYPMQLEAHRAYELRPYDGQVLLVEPETPYAGLLESVLRPYLPKMRAVRLEVGVPDARRRSITARFGELGPHFLSMRDERFVAALARELDLALGSASARTG